MTMYKPDEENRAPAPVFYMDEATPFTQADFDKLVELSHRHQWKPMISFDAATGDESAIMRWLVNQREQTMILLGVGAEDIGTITDMKPAPVKWRQGSKCLPFQPSLSVTKRRRRRSKTGKNRLK